VSKRISAETVYVVERAAGYGVAGDDPVFDPDDPDFDPDSFEEPSSYVPVRVFGDRAAAEAYRAECDAEVRAALPPALYAGYESWERIGGAKAVTAALQALGLPPPKFARDNEWRHMDEFRKWWADHAADLTAEQRAGVWKLFDHLRVYRVTARTLED
jgi:hypothetical protein